MYESALDNGPFANQTVRQTPPLTDQPETKGGTSLTQRLKFRADGAAAPAGAQSDIMME